MGPEGEQARGVQCSRVEQQLGGSSRQGARGGEKAWTAREHTILVREAGGSPVDRAVPATPGPHTLSIPGHRRGGNLVLHQWNPRELRQNLEGGWVTRRSCIASF